MRVSVDFFFPKTHEDSKIQEKLGLKTVFFKAKHSLCFVFLKAMENNSKIPHL